MENNFNFTEKKEEKKANLIWIVDQSLLSVHHNVFKGIRADYVWHRDQYGHNNHNYNVTT